MSCTIKLKLSWRLFGLQPLLAGLQSKSPKEHDARYAILRKVEVPRKEREQYFNQGVPVDQRVAVDEDAIEAAPSICRDFSKAEAREILEMLKATRDGKLLVSVADGRWVLPLRERAEELSKAEDGDRSIELSLSMRMGIEALIGRLEPRRIADQETRYDVLKKIEVKRKERLGYMAEVTPHPIRWDAVESAPDLSVEFDAGDVETLLDDVLKTPEVAVADLEWIHGIRDQIEAANKAAAESPVKSKRTPHR